MVIGMRQEHFMTDSNCISCWGFNYSRLFYNRAEGDNSYLWLHKNRSAHHISKRADVGNSESPPRKLISRKFVISSFAGQFVYFLGESYDIQLISISDYRHNQISGRECDRHPYVDTLSFDNFVPVYADIHHWVVFQ